MNAQPVTFRCQGDTLIGMLHRSPQPATCGVVMVVGGGPQCRIGGHRQLTLWSRQMAEQGFPVLRFDYRGMGDSQGDFRGFMDIDEDLRAAVDKLVSEQPGLKDVVLWGECDASSAILMYAFRDPRVTGVALQNPWVRTEGGAAKAVLKHYYLQRLMQPSFWRKLFSGSFKVGDSLRSLLSLARQARSAGAASGAGAAATAGQGQGPISRELPLPEAMLLGATRFKGRIFMVVSGRDMIAREFDVLLDSSPAWQRLMAEPRVTRHDMADGDHTFSSAEQRGQVLSWGLAWLRGGS